MQISGGLYLIGSKQKTVAGFVQLIQNVDQWRTL